MGEVTNAGERGLSNESARLGIVILRPKEGSIRQERSVGAATESKVTAIDHQRRAMIAADTLGINQENYPVIIAKV